MTSMCHLRGCGRPGTVHCKHCKKVHYCCSHCAEKDWLTGRHCILCGLWQRFSDGNFAAMAKANDAFRCVLQTNTYSQYVGMMLRPGENIGEEVHKSADQQVTIISGSARAKRDDRVDVFHAGATFAIVAGTSHDVQAMGDGDLKILTVYTPPMHRPNAMHLTKAEALAEEEADK